MQLKETTINLLGFFECSIENNVVMCNGIKSSGNDDNGNLVFEAYMFDVLDKETYMFEKGILTIFNQVDDKIMFLYKKEKYKIVSISDDLITFTKGGLDHFIKRIELSF